MQTDNLAEMTRERDELRAEVRRLRELLHTPTATDVANLAKTLANGTWQREKVATTRVATQRELDIVLEDNQRLREEASSLQDALADANGIGHCLEAETQDLWKRLNTIRAIASERIKATPSTDEASVLWAIVNATEGDA